MGEFSQKLLYILIFCALILIWFFNRLGFRKVYKSIKLVTENNENALVSKWEAIRVGDSKIRELQDLEKYANYILEMLKRARGLGNAEKALEIKEIQTKYISKKAEYDVSKFKLAVDASPNLISITDGHGYIFYVNKEIENNLGYKFQEVENKRIIDLWHKDDSSGKLASKI